MSDSVVPSRDVLSSYTRTIFALNDEAGSVTSDESPEARKAAVKSMYEAVARSVRDGVPWNWGLDSVENAARIRELLPRFTPLYSDGFSEQLYFYVMSKTGISDFTSLKLLDVGCGSGDGLNFLSRVMRARQHIGVDLSQEAVNRANARLGRHDLVFECGDAENLPFADSEMDVVINIESSHNYPDLRRFFNEAARVLKPGGLLSYADVFTDARYRQLQASKADSGLEWVQENDISAPVRRAISQRMLPDSLTRERLRSVNTWPIPRTVSEPLALTTLGAEFAGHRFSRAQRFSKALFAILVQQPRRSLVFTRYVHMLARKT
jgi:ubiquinone/menaquinone biosynthesis C-methylase UbiE